MFIAVVPAKNEAKSLKKVVTNLAANHLDLIIPVLNGCTDDSLSVLVEADCPILAPICFPEPLGIDVPRAVGALAARELNARGVLFIDGDMAGVQSRVLGNLLAAVREKGLDLALTDCYPGHTPHQLSSQAACLLEIRKRLNQRLGVFEHIGTATPSHGPHAVSARLLHLAQPGDFAVPPLLLARAAKLGLSVGLGAEIPHLMLGSPVRSREHVQNIVETIIGDCLSALHMAGNIPGGRCLAGRTYNGYHAQRRWDLLEAYAAGKITGNCFF